MIVRFSSPALHVNKALFVLSLVSSQTSRVKPSQCQTTKVFGLGGLGSRVCAAPSLISTSLSSQSFKCDPDDRLDDRLDDKMDEDFVYALSLQEKFNSEQIGDRDQSFPSNMSKSNTCVSVVDDSLELIDPLPDIRQLFLQFNDAYFQGKLAGIEVKWSPRMTLYV